MTDETSKKQRKRGRQKIEGGPARVVTCKVPQAHFAALALAAAHDRRTVSNFVAVAAIERAERILREVAEMGVVV